MTRELPSGHLAEWTFDAISAADTLALVAGPLAGLVPHGFTYTSATCRFCVVERGSRPGAIRRLMGGRVRPPRLVERDARGRPVDVDLKCVFEMRLFGADLDLHWVRCGPVGRLCVLADDDGIAAVMEPASLAHFGLPSATPRPPLAVQWRDHRYLLWGQRSGDPVAGWTRLTTASDRGAVGAVRSGQGEPPAARGARVFQHRTVP